MVFTLSNNINYPKDIKIISIRRIALGRIRGYRLYANAQVLNQYLQDKHNITLKALCTQLVKEKIKINSSIIDQSFTVTFVDKESEKFAKLITFGNLEVRGCDILKFAFDQKY